MWEQNAGGPIRTFLVSLLGAATLTLGILLIRHQRVLQAGGEGQLPGGEDAARAVSLDRFRELGF